MLEKNARRSPARPGMLRVLLLAFLLCHAGVWRGVLARMALLYQSLPSLHPFPHLAELPRPHH